MANLVAGVLAAGYAKVVGRDCEPGSYSTFAAADQDAAFGGEAGQAGHVEGLAEMSEMGTNRSQLGLGGVGAIGHGRGRAVQFEAAAQDGGGLRFGETAGVEEETFGVRGEVAAAGKLGDSNAAESEGMQGALGTGEEEAVAIAKTDDAASAFGLLQLGGADKNLEFARTIAGAVTGRPLGGVQSRDIRSGSEGADEKSGEERHEKLTETTHTSIKHRMCQLSEGRTGVREVR